MLNKNKVLLVMILCVFIALTLRLLAWPLGEKKPEPQIEITDKTLKVVVNAPEPVVKAQQNLQKIENTQTKIDCPTIEDLQSLEKDHDIVNWIYTHIGYGRTDSENYMSIAQLKEQANAQNPHAMFVLASHYAYQAQFKGEYDPSLKADSQFTHTYEPKPLDEEAFAKAQHWFNQAAFYGLIGAYGELAKLHVGKWQRQNDTAELSLEQSLDQSDSLLIKIKAYSVFQAELLPQYFTHKNYQVPQDYSQQQRTQLEANIALLRLQWQKNRAAIGLPIKLDWEIPENVLRLGKGLSCLEAD